MLIPDEHFADERGMFRHGPSTRFKTPRPDGWQWLPSRRGGRPGGPPQLTAFNVFLPGSRAGGAGTARPLRPCSRARREDDAMNATRDPRGPRLYEEGGR